MKLKKILSYISLDLCLMGFLLVLFLVTRAIFSWYGKMLQNFETELQFIGAGLQEGTLENLDILENSLSTFNSQVQWVMILIFIILPLTIYLGHWLTNYIKLNILTNRKWKKKTAFNSLFWGAPYFLVFIITLNALVSLGQEALYSSPKYFLLALLGFILIMIHFTFTCTMIASQKNNLKKNIKKVFLKGMKSMYLYIPMLLTNMIILLMLFLIFVRVATGTFGWINLSHTLVLVVASLLLYIQKNRFIKNVF